MRKESYGIKDIVQHRIESKEEVIAQEEIEDVIEPVHNLSTGETELISVDFSTVTTEAIELPVINDEHGRVSDLLESLEDATKLSVIPLEMGNVAPEVKSLSRHSIFMLAGKRVAMSHRIRYDVINAMQERIIRTLSSALPFEELLNIRVNYKGTEYDTLSLSEDEWTFLMAKFRKYKQELVKTADDKYYLKFFAERA